MRTHEVPKMSETANHLGWSMHALRTGTPRRPVVVKFTRKSLFASKIEATADNRYPHLERIDRPKLRMCNVPAPFFDYLWEKILKLDMFDSLHELSEQFVVW